MISLGPFLYLPIFPNRHRAERYGLPHPPVTLYPSHSTLPGIFEVDLGIRIYSQCQRRVSTPTIVPSASR